MKYSLQNISDLERKLVHPDKNADLVVATTEQGDDLEDLFPDQDYIECLGEEPPLEENRRWRALFDTLKMCMQSGINQNAVLEHSEDDKSWTNLEVVEEASKSSINFLHEDLENQTIPESLVEQGGLAKDEVAYKKNMFDYALELEENFNKYHWNFPRMVSPYDSWKYVEEVDNSGPLLDEPDVEKEDRVSPVNRVNQERKLEESPDKKIQENIKEMTAAELKLKARVKDAEENSRRIGDELDSQRRAVGMAESEKVDLMGREELARGRPELETSWG